MVKNLFKKNFYKPFCLAKLSNTSFGIQINYDFDDQVTYQSYPNSIAGTMYNVTGEIIYKFKEYYKFVE